MGKPKEHGVDDQPFLLNADPTSPPQSLHARRFSVSHAASATEEPCFGKACPLRGRALDLHIAVASKHWVKGRTRGVCTTVEQVVGPLTSELAAIYPLHDRGMIEPERKVDNIIDGEVMHLAAPLMTMACPQVASG